MRTCEIDTRSGRYFGTYEESGVISFKGIPFAKPPVGALRWLPPQPLDTFDTWRLADGYPPAPIQPDCPSKLAAQLREPRHVPVSEDCLYLNVWVADLETPKSGILFWLYGGSYAIGHASRAQSRGEAFVAAHPDIVFVAPNYRLGVFGSLNLQVLEGGERYRYSNNLNLLDQRAALEWVRVNACCFGAERAPITLYGHSAGSNSICHHLASSISNALFQRVICQSSFFEGPPNRTLERSREDAQKIFELLGVRTVDEALKLSAEELLQAQEEYFGGMYGAPVMDGLVVSNDELGDIIDGVAAGKEVLIGCSDGERDGAFAGLTSDGARRKVQRLIRDCLGDASEVADEFLDSHKEEGPLFACGDLLAACQMTMAEEIQARACALHSPVYQFLFRWTADGSACRAPHGAPGPFVFGNCLPQGAPSLLKRQVQETWANFVRKGNPNNDLIPHWEPYTPFGGTVMEINDPWKARVGFRENDYRLLRAYWPVTARI